MRIVIDGRMILPEMSGVGRYLICLCRAFRELKGEDIFELWVQDNLPTSHPVWDLMGEEFHVRNIKTRQMTVSAQWRIPLELARAQPDLFHYPHFDLPYATPGCVVATIHDLKYIVRPDFFPTIGKAKRLIMKQMMSFTCQRAQYIISDSRNTAQDLTKHLGIPKSKIHIVHLGVDPRFFLHPSLQEIRNLNTRYDLNPPYLLFVGERRPHKNIVHLIEAFPFSIAWSDNLTSW